MQLFSYWTFSRQIKYFYLNTNKAVSLKIVKYGAPVSENLVFGAIVFCRVIRIILAHNVNKLFNWITKTGFSSPKSIRHDLWQSKRDRQTNRRTDKQTFSTEDLIIFILLFITVKVVIYAWVNFTVVTRLFSTWGPTRYRKKSLPLDKISKFKTWLWLSFNYN